MKTSPSKLIEHLSSINSNLNEKNWVLFSLSTGGICRGSLNEYSDIDVNIVRRAGLKGAVYSIVYGIYEKKRADFKGIPLDILVSDSPENCKIKTEKHENPVILYDPKGLVPRYYLDQMNIEEAKLLNGLR